MVLIKIATGESWDLFLGNLDQSQNSIAFTCIENATYEDYVENGYEPICCSDKPLSQLFFFSYLTIITLIFMNLFIAIILDGYFDTKYNEEKKLNETKLA